jgi:hypothetical protein
MLRKLEVSKQAKQPNPEMRNDADTIAPSAVKTNPAILLETYVRLSDLYDTFNHNKIST